MLFEVCTKLQIHPLPNSFVVVGGGGGGVVVVVVIGGGVEALWPSCFWPASYGDLHSLVFLNDRLCAVTYQPKVLQIPFKSCR